MSQLYKILQHYNPSEETFVRNVFHYCEEVKLYEYPRELGFCDPNEQKIVDDLCKHFDLKLVKNGGYEQAERALVLILPTEYDLTPEVTKYELTYNRKFNKLEHKHIMGALYNLGIKETLLGDIIVNDEGRVQIVISKELESTLPLLQLKYGKVTVNYELIYEITIENKALRYATRSSKTKRLDSMCKAITLKSRSSSNKEIKKGNVYVNHRQIKDPTYQVKIGDLLSIRGFGRAEIDDIIPVNGKFNVRYYTTKN